MSADVESGVFEIVGRVLGSRDWAPNSDFFELGGNSMGAMQIVWLVQERFGVRVSLTDFFDAPDIASLASLVAERC